MSVCFSRRYCNDSQIISTIHMDLKQIALVTLQTPSSVWEIATLSLHFSSGDCLLVSSFLSHRTARRQVRVTARRGQVTRRIEPQPPLLGAAGSADARLPPVAAPAGRHAGCAGGVNHPAAGAGMPPAPSSCTTITRPTIRPMIVTMARMPPRMMPPIP